MSIQSMSGVLDQINAQSQQIAASQNGAFLPTTAGSKKTSSFSNELLNSINNINTMQTRAQQESQDYMTGASDIGLNDVMVDQQKASVALNFGVQMRNKLVSAYQDIMSMGV
ncbi:flagellar hook-basal body complex protein FliE [Pluralibacter gergoviae]|nr:flagellar hook-basal body complex protein FliE [Pluralibacter gergoviae]MCK1065558.1 flagellar hook-basal body complex protein FliE [Pluralibacter gergoviae]MCV7758674.1 flagellar hook-basal body complex protein FliE [Pluralibacter gergoviae]MDU4002339.1 flagellar hook-basal body complex protein FliE [Pluralibacter gergoviae]OUF45692.1 flagellar hook-basal body complex protein FliE [Pluralibacter gergoviae]OUF48286.1 flagellar hook-basal body complex protein FliE [Pluralibacter gergoviae]